MLNKNDLHLGGTIGYNIFVGLKNILYDEKILYFNYSNIISDDNLNNLNLNFSLPITNWTQITKYEIEQIFHINSYDLDFEFDTDTKFCKLFDFIKSNNLLISITLIFDTNVEIEKCLPIFFSIFQSQFKTMDYFYFFGFNKDNEKEINIFLDQKLQNEIQIFVIEQLLITNSELNLKLKSIKDIKQTYNLLDIWDSFFLSLFSNLLRLKNTDSLEINTLYGGTREIELSENNLLNYIYKTWLENLKVDPFYILNCDFSYYGEFERYLIEAKIEYSKRYLRYYRYVNYLENDINKFFCNLMSKSYDEMNINYKELIIKILNIIIIGWIKKIPYKEQIEKIEEVFMRC